MWVVSYWGPWIDPAYLGVRAKIGELRYYFTDNEGKTFECEAAANITYKGKTYAPKSRCFIPSSISDNIYLEGTGYESQLALLPPELRDKFLLGDFSSGIQADPAQLIPRAWVEAAQARWSQRQIPLDVPRDSLGVDVSRQGNDETYCYPVRGNYVESSITFPKQITKNGITLAHKLAEQMTHRSTVCRLDIAGIGVSPGDHLEVLRPGKVAFMNGADGALSRRDKSGLLGFMNSRAAWYWNVREMLDPLSGVDLALPPEPELLRELCSVRWQLIKGGIKMEDKDAIKKRLGRSPDRADALVNALNEPIVAGAGLLGYYAEEARILTSQKKEEDERHKVTRIHIGG
jgi:hypothetical protein